MSSLPRSDSVLRAPMRRALLDAMTRRGLEGLAGRKELAAMVGVTPETVWSWATGRMTPSHETAAKLSDVLGHEGLIRLSERLRTKACVVCGQPFVDVTSSLKRLACCEAHKRTHATRVRRGIYADDKAESLSITGRMLAMHRDAVGAFCRQCADVCPEARCPLRSVSPVPLPRGEQWAELQRRTPWLAGRAKATA